MKFFRSTALCLAVAFSQAATASGAVSPAVPTRPATLSAGSVVERTAFSTTTRESDGKRRTRLSATPINFKSDSGAWRAIDSELKPDASGELHPVAIDGDVAIPTTLAQPVELERDGETVSFRLLGAAGSRGLSAGVAKFAGAFANVDVTYEARSAGVKETVMLKSAKATRVFRYALSGSAAFSAAVEGGVVVLRDAAGKSRFRFSAPLAWDSAADPSYSDDIRLTVVKEAAGRWIVTMTPDAAWLADPARAYPVSLDPDAYWAQIASPSTDCYVSGAGEASNNYCSGTLLKVGAVGPAKTLLKFDLPASIPSTATIDSALLWAWAPGTVTRPTVSMRLRTVTSAWDNTATWNSRTTGTNWTTGGGDVSTAANLTGPLGEVGDAGRGYGLWAPTETVQRWLNGTLPNNGLQLAATAGAPPTTNYYFYSAETSYSDKRPVLEVVWSAGPPALTISGNFIDGLGSPFQAGDTPTATFTANAREGSLQEVSLRVDGDLVDIRDNTACTANCAQLAGELDVPVPVLDPGAHEAVFEAVDSAGRRTQATRQFTRAPDPEFEEVVDDWATSYTASLGMSAGGLPTAPMPTPPAAAVGTGSCSGPSAGSVTCLKQASGWAANLQTWLRTAPSPAAQPQLPAFPAPSADADIAARHAAGAVAGMIRLAENVARNPAAAQDVGVAFPAPVDAATVNSWTASRTMPAPMAVTGASGAGGWQFGREFDGTQTTAAALETFYTKATDSVVQARQELQAEIAENPNDATLPANLNAAQNVLGTLGARGKLIGSVSVRMNGSSATSALAQASSDPTAPVIVGPRKFTDYGKFQVTEEMGGEESAIGAGWSANNPTCEQMDEINFVKPNELANINPAYWAPSRHMADTVVLPNGNKEHRLRARWLAPKSLAWMCSAGRGERAVEIEARTQPYTLKWSFGWRPTPRWYATNLPGKVHFDDLADGDKPVIEGYPYDKSDWPDFSIVTEAGRDMRYGVMYFTDFETDSGDTGTDANAGNVVYSVQATSRAEGWGEKGYCWSKTGQYASCMFSRALVCYARRAPIAPPVHTGPVDWPAIIGTNDVVVPAGYPNYKGGVGSVPCNAEADGPPIHDPAEVGFERAKLDWSGREMLDLHVFDAQGRHGSVYLHRNGIPNGLFGPDEGGWTQANPEGGPHSESFTQFGNPGPVTFGVCNHSGYSTTGTLRVRDSIGATVTHNFSIGESGTVWTLRGPGGPIPPPYWEWCREGLVTAWP